MKRENELKAVLELGRYVGTGNPDSQILLVSKEPAIPDCDLETYNRDITRNPEQWRQNLEHPDILDKWLSTVREGKVLQVYSDNPCTEEGWYNPRYPYYRQYNIRGTKPGYTNATWSQYQKLFDMMQEGEYAKSAFINFHDCSFQTDINVVTAKYSHLINRQAKLRSIKERLPMFRTPFFLSFPIVIVCIGNYHQQFKNELGEDFLEKAFSVKYCPNENISADTGFINIHYSADRQRMMLHTSHFTMKSDSFIQEVADKCNQFLKQRKG